MLLGYLANASHDIGLMDVDFSIPLEHGYDKGETNLIENKLIDSNPLLEAFGNAKTQDNSNSSRFGKYFQVRFDMFGRIHSSYIHAYLLEKARVVCCSSGERNYHIFY